MKRQFLKDLDLDGEVIDKIMDEHGSSVNSLKEQLSTKKDEVKSLKDERDNYKSKAEDAEDAEDKINSLQTKYDEAKQQLEDANNKLSNQSVDKEIIKRIQDAYDVDDVLNYLDRDKFERDDDGNITNFDDVLNQVREQKPHYFDQSKADTGNNEDNEGNEDNNDGTQGGSNQTGVKYQTGKGQGSGSTGESDYQAIGNAWIEKLGGKKAK